MSPSIHCELYQMFSDDDSVGSSSDLEDLYSFDPVDEYAALYGEKVRAYFAERGVAHDILRQPLFEDNPQLTEGQNDIMDGVSSDPFLENLRKKSPEVTYTANPVDECAVQQIMEFDGAQLKSSMAD
eukprot:CAMPEP_0204601016 /NCGR_PEP_ID=MMETSP0661-20131031/55774_1 /ASSEMBLY_ACC=CAM_ASM_000606 /TAXON_ID=109239 /ORGANISM="Alexandrium margalefi, Strain AMGDE01CS-322" /LENGTH=126 /DNA_ID=CAMNT_0051611859 /DNA_START=252 /DNA_END=629 /DNA_ORIENTATION=+